MVLLSQQTVTVWMDLVVTLITIENVLVLACESKVAFVADKCTYIVLVNAVLFGHDIQTNTNSLTDKVNLTAWALFALMHFPIGLFLGCACWLVCRCGRSGHDLCVGSLTCGLEATRIELHVRW